LKIFVEHHGVLNEQIRRAYIAEKIPVGTSATEVIKDEKNLVNLLRIEIMLKKPKNGCAKIFTTCGCLVR
jgi:hypothetical protein